MRILLTNDDGIHAPGLWAVARTLKRVGEVFVVAPDRDRSGVGTAMTLTAVLRARETPSPVEGIKAYAVEGTPADCVILATESLSSERFDLVVSGINKGANLGMNIMVSGTVGAALHAFWIGIPSIAISVAAIGNVQYEAAARTAMTLARALSANSLPTPLLLNVNLPDIAPDKLKKVEITRVGPSAYLPNVERGRDGSRTHYWIRHNRKGDTPPEPGTDVWAVQNNRVSITPLDTFFGSEPSAAFQVLADETSAELFRA